MRLFIAITLPKEVKDYLWELKEEFRGIGKFNFVAKSRLHITLKFLGNNKEDKLEEIKEKLSKIRFNSFEDSLNQLGCFNNKVLWIDLKQKDNVLKLSKLIDQEFMEREQRFSDHITLARIKNIKKKNEFLKKLKTKINPIKFKINSFDLIKSELNKDGPKYTTLETYSLT
jgi:2'-5' RNA ligase